VRAIPAMVTPAPRPYGARDRRSLRLLWRRWAPWSKGPVALCGDAAHPMMPNLGQGGCQSTEDGYRLAEELANVRHTGDIPRPAAAAEPDGRTALTPFSGVASRPAHRCRGFGAVGSSRSFHAQSTAGETASALARYSRIRVIRTAIVQGFAQLGGQLLWMHAPRQQWRRGEGLHGRTAAASRVSAGRCHGLLTHAQPSPSLLRFRPARRL
jgi:2-polyprenyl-6-methoxyphenol hydroxylase-like FAD-dependent oxidoreductase